MNPSRWLALPAAAAAIVGVAAVVTHGAAPSGAPSRPSHVARVTAAVQPATSTAAEVKRLMSQTTSLQAALGAARKQLESVLAASRGGRAVAASGSSSSLTAEQASLSQEAAQLAAGRQQLAAEQQQLAAEAQSLRARDVLIQQQAAKLAALAKKLSHSGGGSGGGYGDGGGD